MSSRTSRDSPLIPDQAVSFANGVDIASDGRVFFTHTSGVPPYRYRESRGREEGGRNEGGEELERRRAGRREEREEGGRREWAERRGGETEGTLLGRKGRQSLHSQRLNHIPYTQKTLRE